MFHQVLIGRCLQAYPEAAQALRFTNMGTLRKLFQCDFLGVMRFHILQKAAHPGIDRIFLFLRWQRDILLQNQPERHEACQHLIGIKNCFVPFQLGKFMKLLQNSSLPCAIRVQKQVRQCLIGSDFFHEVCCRTAGVKF